MTEKIPDTAGPEAKHPSRSIGVTMLGLVSTGGGVALAGAAGWATLEGMPREWALLWMIAVVVMFTIGGLAIWLGVRLIQRRPMARSACVGLFGIGAAFLTVSGLLEDFYWALIPGGFLGTLAFYLSLDSVAAEFQTEVGKDGSLDGENGLLDQDDASLVDKDALHEEENGLLDSEDESEHHKDNSFEDEDDLSDLEQDLT